MSNAVGVVELELETEINFIQLLQFTTSRSDSVYCTTVYLEFSSSTATQLPSYVLVLLWFEN